MIIKNIEKESNEISKEDLAELKKMEELDKRDKKNSWTKLQTRQNLK